MSRKEKAVKVEAQNISFFSRTCLHRLSKATTKYPIMMNNDPWILVKRYHKMAPNCQSKQKHVLYFPKVLFFEMLIKY